jgi:alkylhydroperoxidase family enzyme
MHIPRIAPAEPPYAAEVQRAFDTVMRGAPPLLLFRTVAQNPRVLQRLMAGGLLDRGSVSLRLRELVILRTCARCGAEYEWGVHVAGFGEKAQWAPEHLYATVHGDANSECWRAEERLAVRLCDQPHDSSHVDDALWADLAAHFSQDQIIELIMLAGSYHSVSYMVNACKIELEALAPRFPDANAEGQHGRELV